MTIVADRSLSPVREVLPNGAVILAKETSATPAVTINVTVRAGSIYEPADLQGLAFFLSRVIDRGTERRDAETIAEALDSRGVSIQIVVRRHRLTMACTCLTEDFASVLDLLADIVRRPTCATPEVEKRRTEILTTLQQDLDNPAIRAVETLMELLYGSQHPYGRSAKGTFETVKGIDSAALREFHRTRFAPSVVTIAIVGDVAPSAAVEASRAAFGDWQGSMPPDAVLPPVPGDRPRRRTVVPMMNKVQADIAYGFTTIRRHDPRFHALELANNILGQYSLGGRLGDNIRERQGMAYYVYSTFDANVLEGPLVIRAGVDPANVDKTIEAIDTEIARIATDVSEEELVDSRRYLVGSLPRMLETNEGIAAFLQTAEHFGLGTDYDVRLPELLGRVTLDEVREVIRPLSPGRATIVIAGPYQGQ